jgi:hypothetical protein
MCFDVKWREEKQEVDRRLPKHHARKDSVASVLSPCCLSKVPAVPAV